MTNPYRAMCAELVDAILTPNPYNWEDSLHDSANRASALLAQPVAEGPTDETPWEIDDDDFLLFSPANAMAFQAQKRSRRGRPTPQPVAVSERLPGDELCWWFEPDEDDGYGGMWTLLRIRGGTTRYTHWLPANALPTPEVTNE